MRMPFAIYYFGSFGNVTVADTVDMMYVVALTFLDLTHNGALKSVAWVVGLGS